MPKGRSVGPPLAIQVDPIELIHHDAAFTCTTHLQRDQPSFAEQLPQAPTRKPEEEFALLNLLAKMFEAMNKADPNNPEGVVLRAMAKNFVTPETKQALDTGAPLQPQKPNEFKTAEFAQAMKALAQKYKNDPPKRDAVMCIAAAAHGRPLTAEDVFLVFQNLAEGVQLTPEQWLQILQLLVQAATGMKKEAAKDWQRQMAAQRNPNAMDLANLLQRDLDVRPDGTIAPRHAPIPTVQKGEDTMGLLEMSRDFWMALFKAHQDKKIRDEMEHDIAQLLKNVGQKYVRAGRTEDPVAMDAKANRHLIRKLRENPMIQADEAKMAALDKLAKAETTGRSPTPKELVEIFEALGKGVPMTPGMLKIILEYLIANMRGAKQAEDLAPVQKVLKSGDKIDPVEAIRAMNTAFVRKPDESAAIVELFANVFLAMAATKQNAALRENHQRMLADALQDVAKAHGPGGQLDNDAYRMKLMRLRANPHSPGLTGLKNLGNSCYMNSTIQCLSNIPPFAAYFVHGKYRRSINYVSVLGSKGEVARNFAVLLAAMWEGRFKYIIPFQFKQCIGKVAPVFAGYEQQDSQEFLAFLLDGLHEDLNLVKDRRSMPEQNNEGLKDEDAAHRAWINHKRLHSSFIVDMFQGQYLSVVKCRVCHRESRTFDVFMYLSLPIPSDRKCRLEDCLQRYSAPEDMTGDCKYLCPYCNRKRDAVKRIMIWKLPKVLLIHLNRFSCNGRWREKLQTNVDFPTNRLDMSEYCQASGSNYTLLGVSNHYGTMEGGHYTAYCKNANDSRWYKFDDHEVSPISQGSVKSPAAYILYYIAEDFANDLQR